MTNTRLNTPPLEVGILLAALNATPDPGGYARSLFETLVEVEAFGRSEISDLVQILLMTDNPNGIARTLRRALLESKSVGWVVKPVRDAKNMPPCEGVAGRIGPAGRVA
jgi:hypothetical protein